jgi:CheY-like chemotaxis protein
MNLLSNAAEAIEGPGTVVVTTESRYGDRPLRGDDRITAGAYVLLSVRDSGRGISTEERERIFEAFYTQKVMGRSGSGLGLTVVWNVMQDHEGSIDVKSDGQGTCFELYFPVTHEEVPARPAALPLAELLGQGERVLVIDDVPAQREISCQMLAALGYQAESVASGEAAVAHLQRQTADLLLLDMIMDPGINGRETYERILRLCPEQKAVIVSGYAATEEVQETLRLGAARFLRKPFTLEGLGKAVKETLGP